MLKFVSLRRVLVAAAALGATLAPAIANPPAPDPVKPGMQCSDKALIGTGPGFKDSREASELAAKDDWLTKAKAVYPDADFANAKDVKWECVKQGLYSKCFVSAVPCRPKPE